jgi:hypothetical protein
LEDENIKNTIYSIVEESIIKNPTSIRYERFERVGSYEIEPGRYHILDYPVNIRSQPNINGEIIGRLYLNDEIEVVENMGNEQQIDGVWQYWYKINFDDLYGYIWGGNISLKTLVFENEDNNYFLYSRVSFIHRIYNTNPSNVRPDQRLDELYWDSPLTRPDDIFIYINNRKISIKSIERYYEAFITTELGEHSSGPHWQDVSFWYENNIANIFIYGTRASQIFFTMDMDGNIEFRIAGGP